MEKEINQVYLALISRWRKMAPGYYNYTASRKRMELAQLGFSHID